MPYKSKSTLSKHVLFSIRKPNFHLIFQEIYFLQWIFFSIFLRVNIDNCFICYFILWKVSNIIHKLYLTLIINWQSWWRPFFLSISQIPIHAQLHHEHITTCVAHIPACNMFSPPAFTPLNSTLFGKDKFWQLQCVQLIS